MGEACGVVNSETADGTSREYWVDGLGDLSRSHQRFTLCGTSPHHPDSRLRRQSPVYTEHPGSGYFHQEFGQGVESLRDHLLSPVISSTTSECRKSPGSWQSITIDFFKIFIYYLCAIRNKKTPCSWTNCSILTSWKENWTLHASQYGVERKKDQEFGPGSEQASRSNHWFTENTRDRGRH